jgi:putative DNA methylase
MTRMIERWFPCEEVSDNSRSGWGSGNAEVGIMTWFAKRPTAQAKAATICSLLPWPDDPAEQSRLQDLVRGAMTGRYENSDEIQQEVLRSLGDRVSTLDPFSGRGMIPLETARLGLHAFAIDYSPVAVLASRLLTDFPCRNWDDEPPLPYADDRDLNLLDARPRLVRDVEAVLSEIGTRHRADMASYYPKVEGRDAWGYLWAITIPCQECSRYFPLIGQLDLRKPSMRKDHRTKSKFHDPGQSYYVDVDRTDGTWSVVVHDGPPQGAPTRQVPPGKSKYDSNGRVAVCPFCRQPHDRHQQTRILESGLGRDVPLLASDIDPDVGKSYRPLEQQESDAIEVASVALSQQPGFGPFLSAVPNERIPDGNTWTVQATVYGARTYGDMMNDRQTLSFITFARSTQDIGREIAANGNSEEYVRALTGYAAAALARKIRRATRGCTLDVSRSGVHDIFATESSINFSFDYFEVGLSDGPGSWDSVAGGTLSALSGTMPPAWAVPCDATRGSAVSLPFRDRSITAVVTDPPYDAMIDYTDASDLFYVWVKRALASSWPELGMTAHPLGVQEKDEEIIVKKGGTSNNDHRDRKHYDRLITQAFREAQRVVAEDGVVTIVFGHGEPEVWKRLLSAIQEAGLILTGAWPAKTEPGGKAGFTNIVTTLTMACRPAPSGRPVGRKGTVETDIKAEVKRRYPDWERWGLAPTDMLMAAAGPAMEVVGRYAEVRDARGEPVDISTFLPLARAAVQEAMAVEISHQPLDTFDARTRFALWWINLYGRQAQAKSELRWQTLASSLDLASIRDLIPDADKGVRFVTSRDYKGKIDGDSAIIDIALALAAASESGLEEMGQVLVGAQRAANDTYLWATIQFMADKLPDNDPDAIAFTRVLRNREGVTNAAESLTTSNNEVARRQIENDSQLRLL